MRSSESIHTPGHLSLTIKDNGYRYSIDPFLIAAFTELDNIRYAVDLGAGNGIIPILLARKSHGLNVIGIEIQQTLAIEAKNNVLKNHLSDRVTILCCDINNAVNLIASGKIDMVIGNPPYRRCNDGKINPDMEKAIARHEIRITIAQYIRACGRLVRARGRVSIIYHPYRLPELLGIMAAEHIRPCRMRFVHSKQGSQARMVMVEGIKNGKNDLTVLEPLFIYREDNNYSEEMMEIYRIS